MATFWFRLVRGRVEETDLSVMLRKLLLGRAPYAPNLLPILFRRIRKTDYKIPFHTGNFYPDIPLRGILYLQAGLDSVFIQISKHNRHCLTAGRTKISFWIMRRIFLYHPVFLETLCVRKCRSIYK